MRVIDASAAIHAWDNYPIKHFPKLWEWLAAEIESFNLCIPAAALDEVGHKAPDCRTWLVEKGCLVVNETVAVVQAALAIKQSLGIENDQYHVDGVDENDVIIIATAKANGHSLISNENRQPTLPVNLKRWKIPAVCNRPEVGVECTKFLDYFKASNQVF